MFGGYEDRGEVMIRLLVFGTLVYFGYLLVKKWLRSILPPPPAAEGPTSRRGETMVEDLQCGTFIPAGSAITATVAGEKKYFCSKKCRDAYLAAR